MELSRAARAWDEDHVLPRMWDANGHARGILAPGGYICKTDPEGKKFELFCYGFRNQFDIAFNDLGELFTYDADMEWDIGSPWYRPTRINHCVSGGDYGWRSGAGKWPTYYPDSLPAAVDIGPGSPTGVCSGTGAKFPAKYQRAIFARGLDLRHDVRDPLRRRRARAYKSTKEEFVSGSRCRSPISSSIRRTARCTSPSADAAAQSALYRVTYTGTRIHRARAEARLTAGDEAAPRARDAARGRHRPGGDRQSAGRISRARIASCATPRASPSSASPRRCGRRKRSRSLA